MSPTFMNLIYTTWKRKLTQPTHLVHGQTHRCRREEISISGAPSWKHHQVSSASLDGSGRTPSGCFGWNSQPHSPRQRNKTLSLRQLHIGPFSSGCFTPIWPPNTAIHTNCTPSTHLQCQLAQIIQIFSATNPLEFLGKCFNNFGRRENNLLAIGHSKSFQTISSTDIHSCLYLHLVCKGRKWWKVWTSLV